MVENASCSTGHVAARNSPPCGCQYDSKSLRRRADIFTYEADRCGLPYVPYKGGFFISIPTQQSAAVCQALEADLVFAGPLAQGVRLGVCSIPEIKMQGLAAIVKKALDRVEGRTDLLAAGK